MKVRILRLANAGSNPAVPIPRFNSEKEAKMIQFIRINISQGKVETFKVLQYNIDHRHHNPLKNTQWEKYGTLDTIWAQLPDGRVFPMTEEWDGKTFFVPCMLQTQDNPYIVDMVPYEPHKETRLKFAFKNKNQTPLLMIWREWLEDGEVVFAEVVWSSDRLFGRKKTNDKVQNQV
jgi:hypothetical protein